MRTNYLDYLNPDQLQRDSTEIWKMINENLDEKNLIYAYDSCIFQGKEKVIMPIHSVMLSKGEKLYRIRRGIKGYDQIRFPDDFSYNPNAKYGRFNCEGEKVLYLSTSVDVTMAELDIKSRELFFLIEYTLREDLVLRPVFIGNRFEEKKGEILNGFINEIFQKRHSENPNIYRATSIIKNLYPFMLDEETKGWLYPSTKTKGLNVALTYPKANGYLQVSDFHLVFHVGDDLCGYITNLETENWIERQIQKTIVI